MRYLASGKLLILLLLSLSTHVIQGAAEEEVIDLDTPSDGKQGSGKKNEKDDEDSTQFRHFVAHNKTMTCSADEHALPFNNQIRGANLGGWMVLEPWITPSLFYQFLGEDENSTAFDMYTFCEVLGPKEANRQLRRHWETWVTEAVSLVFLFGMLMVRDRIESNA